MEISCFDRVTFKCDYTSTCHIAIIGNIPLKKGIPHENKWRHGESSKMAAVGCMESCGQDSEECQTEIDSKLDRFSRKNGLSHHCYCNPNSVDCNINKSVFYGKNHRLNGSLKQNSFTKPSTPALRSRSERNSVGNEPPKRKRRLSRHDKTEVNNA